MNLYIETENGTFKNHPAFEHNLIQAFGSVPSHWEAFTRVEKPTLGVYELMTAEEATYEKVNNTWTDVWHKRDMTAEEKTAKQQDVITAFSTIPYASNFSTWTLDEDTCAMVPPVAQPAINLTKIGLGIFTLWSGADNNWKDTPKKPFDEKLYDFDYTAWQWVELTTG
jgi:hypothetical protein